MFSSLLNYGFRTIMRNDYDDQRIRPGKSSEELALSDEALINRAKELFDAFEDVEETIGCGDLGKI